MTEKRFEINNLVKKGNMSFWDNKNKLILNASHTLDLLNNLSEDYDYLEKRFKEEEWHYERIDEDRDVWMHKCHVLEKENEQLKKSKKGQELEIVRLHHLADAMSGVLRELGIYDVYNQKQINKVKKELQRND